MSLGLPDPGAALKQVFSAAASSSGIYAPSPRGSTAARHSIAENYLATGVAIAPENLLLTASSSESYSFLFKLLCDPGDAVLVPTPSYPLFDGVLPLPYRLSYQPEGRWHIDLHSVDETLDRAARAGQVVRALVVVSPNNPTGSVLDERELTALDARAAARGAALIADEVFADYVRRPSPTHVRCVAARATQALTFSLGGLSKSCGLPQLKVGWIAVGGPPAIADAALGGLDLIADTYLSVNAPAERALPDLLRLGAATRAALIARLATNAGFLGRTFDDRSSLTILDHEGGWSAILRVPATRTDEEWTLALLEDDPVLVQPGYFFDLEGGTFLVISLLPGEDAFQEGVRRLAMRIDE